MAATSIHQPIQTPAPNALLWQCLRTYSIFLLCASLYLIPFMRLLLIGTDEGLLVSGAVRVAHGQVFARPQDAPNAIIGSFGIETIVSST